MIADGAETADELAAVVGVSTGVSGVPPRPVGHTLAASRHQSAKWVRSASSSSPDV
ncbi:MULTISPECIES: hypothetical protein [Frankia]|uniref:hypothetical protein n=1 Tax=Frankia TaxID=1854 RepID=UPI0002FA449E|nr:MULTISPECIES: hypothetical protein [Frankia]